MKNIFFVPFCGRFDTLHAALQSLIDTFTVCQEVLVIVDVSNPNFVDKVDSLASSLLDPFPTVSFVSCERDDSTSIVESWFRTIFNYCSGGDLVHFLGDDDILISRSFSSRVEILSKVDYCVYSCLSRIFFLPHASYVADLASLDSFLNDELLNYSTHSFDPFADNLYQSFISICSFKVSSTLRSDIFSFLELLKRQYWLKPTFAHAMFFHLFPFYLHYSSSLNFQQSDLFVSIRGCRIIDMFASDYSDGGSRGLYLSSSLHVLTRLLTLPPEVIDRQSIIHSKYIENAHLSSLYHSTYLCYLDSLSQIPLSFDLLPRSRNYFTYIMLKIFTLSPIVYLRRLIFIALLYIRSVPIYSLSSLLKLLR